MSLDMWLVLAIGFFFGLIADWIIRIGPPVTEGQLRNALNLAIDKQVALMEVREIARRGKPGDLPMIELLCDVALGNVTARREGRSA